MHITILKRCGVVLIAIGALDIAYMVWCIANQTSYSSSLNIFALVGGILLFRGGLKTARWVATFSTFMLAACGILMLIMPFMYPLGYWLAVFRHGSDLIIPLFITAALFALLFWVRQQVTHPDVLQAQLTAGLLPPKTKLAAILGLILPVLLVTLLGFMFRGETAHEAMHRAEQQLGRNYQYVVTNIQINSNAKGKRVFAIVAAYNDDELKNIEVKWEE